MCMIHLLSPSFKGLMYDYSKTYVSRHRTAVAWLTRIPSEPVRIQLGRAMMIEVTLSRFLYILRDAEWQLYNKSRKLFTSAVVVGRSHSARRVISTISNLR